MRNEKVLLLSIFSLFFIISALLMFVMIKKDLIRRNEGERRMSQPINSDRPENLWPKVEIQTSK